MVQFTFATIVAALTTLVSTAPLATVDGFPAAFRIATIAPAPSQLNGLMVTSFHSGAGLNNVIMLPIGYSTIFHYNSTSKSIYFVAGTGSSKFTYEFGLSENVPQATRIQNNYKIMAVNIDGSSESTGWFYDGDLSRLMLQKPPVGFQNFAVCNVKEAADDEPISSYQQLVWRTSSTSLPGCSDVILKLHSVY